MVTNEGIGLVANPSLLGKRRSTPLNRLKEDQSKKTTIFSRLPHLMGAVHVDGRTGGGTLEPRSNQVPTYRCRNA
jgi:hypothetical protein